MRKRIAALGMVVVAGLTWMGCNVWEEGTSPVAPAGTVLTVRANPTSISLFGVSQVTVVALHSSGVPARTNTEVRLSTDLGTLAETVLLTDPQGSASTTLTGDGLAGTATVRASSGALAPVTVSVTIAASALKAAFTATVAPSPGLTVVFEDTSAGNPTEWEWDFGDGSSSTQADPVHTYAAAGSFLVTLTVSNPAGADSTSQFINVPAAAAAATAVAGATAGGQAGPGRATEALP